MNSANTIVLLSSATLCRSPPGLISMKYPSLSVLRFPAKNSYVGVAASSNNFMKIKEDDDKEGDSSNTGVSIMMDEVSITGPKKDVEALVVKVRKARYKKIIIFAFVCILLSVDGMMFLIHMLRSSFAESTFAGTKQLTAVALGVAIALPPVIRHMKAFVEQEIERMKVTYVNKNQGAVNDTKHNKGSTEDDGAWGD